MGKITTFTPEEIAELERKPSDIMRDTIAATGSQAAIDAFDAYREMFIGAHNGLAEWLTYAMTAGYKANKEVLMDVLKGYFKPLHASLLDGYWEKPFKERVLICIGCFRNVHDCAIKFIGEDEDKLTFVLNPCGSGQMLVESGIYEPTGTCAMCKAHPMTAGLDDFPVYCIHAPIAEICVNEMGEVPVYQQDYPEKVGTCSCVINVYKDKNKVPDEYFTRLGLKRPQ